MKVLIHSFLLGSHGWILLYYCTFDLCFLSGHWTFILHCSAWNNASAPFKQCSFYSFGTSYLKNGVFPHKIYKVIPNTFVLIQIKKWCLLLKMLTLPTVWSFCIFKNTMWGPQVRQQSFIVLVGRLTQTNRWLHHIGHVYRVEKLAFSDELVDRENVRAGFHGATRTHGNLLSPRGIDVQQ